MPKAILPIRNDEERQGDRDRQEVYNPDFGLTKSLTAKIGDKGSSGKLNFVMIVQILLAFYYAVGYVFEQRHFHTYYVWPTDEEYPATLFFRTDVESFQCQGYDLYRVDKGPDPKRSNGTSNMVGGDGWKYSLGFWIFMIFSFILFCFLRLYRGHYNQLIGFITFESKHHSPPKVAKFGLVFTVVCNFSKGAGSLRMTEQCGLMAFNLAESSITFGRRQEIGSIFTIIYLFCFALITLWLVIWGFCFVFNEQRDDCCTGKASFWMIRIILVVTILFYYLIGAEQFNPKINFDLQYPNWAAISALSYVDLVISTIADLYFNRPCGWIFAKCTASDNASTFSSKQTTAGTTSTSDIPESPSASQSASQSSPSFNENNIESRIEQGIGTLDPMAAAAEQYVNYQAHCGENEGKAYEKKIKDDVSMDVRANHVNLAENPYYIQGKRNDGALQELSAMLAECPDDEKEVLLVLRALQRNAIGLSDAQSKGVDGACNSTE